MVADIQLGPKHCISAAVDDKKIDELTTGILDSGTGKVKIPPFQQTKPSCALNENGILHQEWLMEGYRLAKEN
jgi:hypothetical protein